MRATTQDDQPVLEVEDNGPGLKSEELDRVFERFWRASELPGGCGLGLAIVAEIAQRHGRNAQARLANVEVQKELVICFTLQETPPA